MTGDGDWRTSNADMNDRNAIATNLDPCDPYTGNQTDPFPAHWPGWVRDMVTAILTLLNDRSWAIYPETLRALAEFAHQAPSYLAEVLKIHRIREGDDTLILDNGIDDYQYLCLEEELIHHVTTRQWAMTGDAEVMFRAIASSSLEDVEPWEGLGALRGQWITLRKSRFMDSTPRSEYVTAILSSQRLYSDGVLTWTNVDPGKIRMFGMKTLARFNTIDSSYYLPIRN